MTLLNGIGVCPGIAVGPLVRMPDPVPEPPAGPSQVADRNAERSRISPAMEAVATELRTHITQPEAREASDRYAEGMRQLQAEDVARAVLYVVTQPPHVAVNEVLVRPTDQER